MENKKIILGIMAAMIFSSLVGIVLADSFAFYCIPKGESVDFGELCNPLMNKLTGPTNVCVHILDNGKICPAIINKCNALGSGCVIPGNSTIDSEPPTIDLISPDDGSLFSSRSVFFDISLDERADVYYLDLIKGRGKWTRLCTNCNRYIGKRSFNDGLNQLMIRAKDKTGNAGFLNVSFLVDSKKPKITNTEPRRGFIGSEFEVKFIEENPDSLKIHYGNSLTGFEEQDVDLNSCVEDRGRKVCMVDVNLFDFDGQKIEYWFHLIDIVGNEAVSKKVSVDVDETSPVINSLDFNIIKRQVTFIVNVTETNLDAVEYIDNSASNPRFKLLCSRLKDEICKTSRTFAIGNHDVSIQVTDKAGNAVAQSINFDIN